MHYKGLKKSLPEIARELQVEAVVEGSVLRSNDRVRINARLIQVPGERKMWAEGYERELRDILALQSDVAKGGGAKSSQPLPRGIETPIHLGIRLRRRQFGLELRRIARLAGKGISEPRRPDRLS
jgi:hypothetical protein